MNADFVKPAVAALGLVAKGESFGWHRFRHSLSTWANETTKDITVSQTLLRHSKPEMTAVYTHGNFPKALDAQRHVWRQLLFPVVLPHLEMLPNKLAKNNCTAALVVENGFWSVKRRQALPEGNLPRNSRLETHRSR